MIKTTVKDHGKGEPGLMVKEIRTVNDSGGVPMLENVKEDGLVTIYEADDMDRQIHFPVSAIPVLISHLENLR
jgi:hypothetical protein